MTTNCCIFAIQMISHQPGSEYACLEAMAPDQQVVDQQRDVAAEGEAEAGGRAQVQEVDQQTGPVLLENAFAPSVEKQFHIRQVSLAPA